MHVASSSALPGSNSIPAPVPSRSSASPPVRAAIERRAAGQGLQGDDAERLVQRGDHDAAGAVDRVAELHVGEEADEPDDVADALDVDLRLELGEVAAAAGDDALDVGHAGAQRAHRPGEDLEPLLVLDAAPREHERPAAVGMLAGRPPRRIDAVGHVVHPLRGDLEPGDHLAAP